MKAALLWSGGKECCLAYHKAIEKGHNVDCLLTFVYMEPYIFHNLLISDLQSKTLGTPLLRFKIKDSKNPYDEMLEVFTRLNKTEGIEAIVTGDIVGAGCARLHQVYYEIMCKKSDMNLIMPLENPSGDTYDVLDEEISNGLRPIMTCINLDYFDEEWLGRELDKHSIKELNILADRQGIDVCSEDGRGYHTMVIDSPLFKETVEISKFSKEFSKTKNRSWYYMDIKGACLNPKK